MGYAKRGALKRGNFLIILTPVTALDILRTKATQLENWIWGGGGGGFLCDSDVKLGCAACLGINTEPCTEDKKSVQSFLPHINTCTDVNFGSIVPLEQPQQPLCLWRLHSGFGWENTRCGVVSPGVEMVLSPLVCSDFDLLWGARWQWPGLSSLVGTGIPNIFSSSPGKNQHPLQMTANHSRDHTASWRI